MTTHVLGDTGVLTGRSLRHILRSPDTIITTAVTPIALMLLFVVRARRRDQHRDPTSPTSTTCSPASC